MNPLLVEALGAILRWGLAIGAGYIVERGIWTAESASIYVGAAALALLSLGWSLWQKLVMRTKFMTALTMPAGSTERQVEAVVASGQAASVTTQKADIPQTP